MEGPTIGILSPLMTGYYYGSLVSSVNRVVSAAGGRLVAVSTAAFASGHHRGRLIEHLPHLGWDHIDGFVTLADAVTLDHLEALRAAGKPVVALGDQKPGFNYPCVLPDNHGGTRQAVEHLIEHGHTRIAFAGSLQQFDIQERYTAYCNALVAHDIDPDPDLLYDTEDNNETGGQRAAQRMLDAGLPSTAVVAACDRNALGIVAVLNAAGLVLPTDQAITGFDDLPGVAFMSPSLSSVSQHLDEMGGLAAQLVLRMVAGQDVGPGPYLVDGSFIPRHSCGCAANPLTRWRRQEGSWPAPLPAFTEAMRRAVAKSAVGGRQVFPAERLWEMANKLKAVLERSVQGEVGTEDLVALSHTSQKLYQLSRTHDAFDAILDFVARTCADLEDVIAQSDQAALRRLHQCAQEVRLGLSQALLNERNDAYYELRNAVRDEHEISLDLLRSHESDPRSLDWLRRTKAAAAVLALWEDEPERGLKVVGTFDRAGRQNDLVGKLWRAEEFPPAQVLGAAGRGNVVLLFPVTSEERDWGILSVVVPLDSGFLGQDTYFQWEALLSEALDYQDVLSSLRQRGEQLRDRGEQLVSSYRREREMAQAVRESEERYALAARAANDGLWDWDLDRGTVYYSSRFAEMLGYEDGTIGNSPDEWLERVHPEDRAGLKAQLVALKLGEQASILHEHRALAGDGTYLWLLCRGLAVPGAGRPATRIVGAFTDITERRLLEERLRQQALYDSLTGLPNRALFLDRLSQALANAKRRSGHTYAVLWLDLDGFKILNDSLGHQMGDKLLVQVAGRLRNELRESDTAARFGGDEFAVLLLDVPDTATLRNVVHRVLERLGSAYDLDGHEIVVTASIGVATSATGYDRPEDVLRDADIAMYRAKADGRGTYAVFDSSMHATALARLKTETELRQAIEPRGPGNSQMELHYQPVVSLESGEVVGLEALVRWRHPLRGLVTPLEFLQVAEDSGLVVPMGRWVAREACRQLAAWESMDLLAHNVRVSLNLSNREFWSPRLLDSLDVVLKESGVQPERLAFEITEGVIIDNLDTALVVLHELHARGLQVHVDDFGTGYSSLQALHRLPLDALKIDKSFVAGLGHDERTAELVRTMVQLGNNLGVTVIAEGIETPSQLRGLRQLGCCAGQGFIFSPPVPAARLEHLIAAGRFGPKQAAPA